MARASTSPALAGVKGPVRTCLGCRARAAKSDLLRVVARADTYGRMAVVPDPAAVAPGRGGYLHPDVGCVDTAIRRRALTRALRVSEALDTSPLTEHFPLVHSP